MNIGGESTYINSTRNEEEKTHIKRKTKSLVYTRDKKLFGNKVKWRLTILKQKPRNQKTPGHILTAT